MGEGGIVLNQLHGQAGRGRARQRPEEAGHRRPRCCATCTPPLPAARCSTTANLKFQPLPLDEQCNQYLTKDRGWFDGGRDLAHLPVGEQRLRRRDVPDPRLPHLAAALVRDAGRAGGRGPAAQGGQGPQGRLQGGRAVLPAHVQPHGRVAPPKPAGRSRRSLFKYVVHYADGQTAEVPVLYGEGRRSLDQPKSPAGLKSAVGGLGGARSPATSPREQAVRLPVLVDQPAARAWRSRASTCSTARRAASTARRPCWRSPRRRRRSEAQWRLSVSSRGHC